MCCEWYLKYPYDLSEMASLHSVTFVRNENCFIAGDSLRPKQKNENAQFTLRNNLV